MNLQSIQIKKLFGLFNYDIQLNKRESVTILTGPNGYGKTTILNILYNLFNQRFFYFERLDFEEISVFFCNGHQMVIRKGKEREETKAKVVTMNGGQKQLLQVKEIVHDIEIKLLIHGKSVEHFTYNREKENYAIQQLVTILVKSGIPIQQITPTVYLDMRSEKQVTLRDFLHENSYAFRNTILNVFRNQEKEHGNTIEALNSQNVYIIKEQRLIDHNPLAARWDEQFTHAIERCALDLKERIIESQREAYAVGQKIDAEFPLKITQEKMPVVSENDIRQRFERIERKQRQLINFGILRNKLQIPEKPSVPTGALAIFLDGFEQKLNAYDELLSLMTIFVENINKKYSHKNITITADEGFCFTTETGQRISSLELSSGEQQEVVLLYEILFKARRGSLILIDEPEISLHPEWEYEVVSDFESIAKEKDVSFLIATHSPQIVNGNWETMVRDLFELSDKEQVAC